MKVAEMCVEMGNEWGNLGESVSQSTLQNYCLGSGKGRGLQRQIIPAELSRLSSQIASLPIWKETGGRKWKKRRKRSSYAP